MELSLQLADDLTCILRVRLQTRERSRLDIQNSRSSITSLLFEVYFYH